MKIRKVFQQVDPGYSNPGSPVYEYDYVNANGVVVHKVVQQFEDVQSYAADADLKTMIARVLQGELEISEPDGEFRNYADVPNNLMDMHTLGVLCNEMQKRGLMTPDGRFDFSQFDNKVKEDEDNVEKSDGESVSVTDDAEGENPAKPV